MVFSCASGQKKNLRKAKRFLKAERLVEAAEVIGFAIANKKTSSNPESWYLASKILFEVSKIDTTVIITESLEKLRIAKKLDVNSNLSRNIQMQAQLLSDYFLRRGKAEFNSGNFVSASNYYTHALSSDSLCLSKNDTKTTYNLALSLKKAGNFSEALPFYENLSKEKYEQPLVYISYVELVDTLKINSKLEIIKNGFTVISDEYVDDYFKIVASNYLINNRIHEFAEIIDIAKNTTVKTPLLLYYSARLKLAEKDTVSAKKIFHEIINIDATNFYANYELGVLEYQESMAFLTCAERLPRNEISNFYLLKEKGVEKFAIAELHLIKANEQRPNQIALLEILMQTLRHQQKYYEMMQIRKKIDTLKCK